FSRDAIGSLGLPHYLLCIVVFFACQRHSTPRNLHSFPTRRSSDLLKKAQQSIQQALEFRPETAAYHYQYGVVLQRADDRKKAARSEEHTSELQSRENLVCRLLLEKKNTEQTQPNFRNHHARQATNR